MDDNIQTLLQNIKTPERMRAAWNLPTADLTRAHYASDGYSCACHCAEG